jgi:L-lactate dehydrogenase complex protein LldE
MVDALYPHVGLATVELLERHGVQVVFPDDQTCCGQPAFNAGYRDEARAVARHFLDVFWPLIDRGDVSAVVAPSGSCVAMVKHFYRVLFAGAEDDVERNRSLELSRVTYELTQFLVDVLGVEQVEARFAGKLTYHPCCHLLRELLVDAQPRRLLASLDGAEVVTLPGDEECCGFGGLFALENAAISTAMGRRKVRHLTACGADVVAMNDVSCMTHVNGILKRDGHCCRAVHIAELLGGHVPAVPRERR